MSEINPTKNRGSIRLQEYDYTQPGAYFITICTQDRFCFFGEISDEKMILNNPGQMVQEQWTQLPERFCEIIIDEFIIMPNHMHSILIINEMAVAAPLVGARSRVGSQITERAGTRPAPTLGEIIGAFKSITTNKYIRWLKQNNWPPVRGKLWQRNYYERVIRDENELNRIREYIMFNPARWQFDRDNTSGKPDETERRFWQF